MNKNLTNSKLVPTIKANTKVNHNDDTKKVNTKDRIMFGRAVFLPFFNRPIRPRPRIASFMRRTGIAEYHPLHKYCLYRIYRYKKR
ncbi:hypothetical protein WA026_002287 [Henosepilachna vigintioctopunctata]|uniref:Uncharacterized protein n=1 Tax=Henosepilachna vigintioctopunctata TaxID=420089 RepID=A0AAW1TZS8_9CUCU